MTQPSSKRLVTEASLTPAIANAVAPIKNLSDPTLSAALSATIAGQVPATVIAQNAGLEKWFANGIKGKKIVFVGDSTTEYAYGLNRALQNYYTRRGRELEGVAVLNYGVNGQSLAQWNADPTRYGKAGAIAQQADLYVFDYGINDVRLGALTEDQFVALLGQAVDDLRAGAPNTTVLLRMPNTFTTTDTGTLGFVSPNGSAQAYSTLLRNAYIRVAAAKGCPLLDTQARVFGLTSQADTASPYMLNQIHPNDAGNIAVARELVKMIGVTAPKAPGVFSMPGKIAVGTIGSQVFTNGANVAWGFASYRPATSGSFTVELRKIPVGGGAGTVIGTATYSGGFGSGNVVVPGAALADWTTLAAGEALRVAVTAASGSLFDLEVFVNVDESPRAATYPLQLRGAGLVSSLDGSTVYAATESLDTTAHERTIGGYKAVGFKRLGYNRITKWSQDFTKTNWVKSNATVAGTAGTQVITATAAGAFCYQLLTVTPGEQLTFSWKGTSTATTPRFGVYDFTNGAFLAGASTAAWPTADGAGWFNFAFTVPAGCTSLRVYPIGNSGAQGANGDTYTLNATMVSAGASRLPYAQTNSIGTEMIVNTGALPSDFTSVHFVKVDAFVAGQVSAVMPGGPNTDGNPALQGRTSTNAFGYPVVTTRGTVPMAAAGAWQPAVLRATGGNVYVTVNDQAPSPALVKTVNATDLRWNLLSSTDTTGAFQNWDGEVLSFYFPYLLTDGEAQAFVRSVLRTLIAAGETVTADWPAQKLA